MVPLLMKYVESRPYATAEAAAARLLEIAKTIGADRRGMIPVGVWNATFLNRDKASAAEYGVGRDHLIAAGLIKMHDSGTCILWGPSIPIEDRTEMSLDLKFPTASLGLP